MTHRSNHSYTSLLAIASLVLAQTLSGVASASVCTVGPTTFVELDNIVNVGANIGFNNTVGSSFDWANAGAAASPRSCTAIGNGVVQSCTGAGGLFNDSSGCTAAGEAGTASAPCCTGPGTGTCGQFVNSTTAPVAPIATAAAQGDPTVVGSSRVDLQACKLEYSIVSPK